MSNEQIYSLAKSQGKKIAYQSTRADGVTIRAIVEDGKPTRRQAKRSGDWYPILNKGQEKLIADVKKALGGESA